MNQTSPSNTQNYNRFSYVLNNPLKYTDPSGYNYIDPNGNFVWGMGVKPSSNNVDGAGKYNDCPSYWDNQWINRESDWGGLEETLNSLFDMGKNPKGFIRKGNGDIYYSWMSDKESEFKNEKVWLKKTRTFNHVLLFQNTSKKNNIKRIIKENASGGGFCAQCHNPNSDLYYHPDLVQMRVTKFPIQFCLGTYDFGRNYYDMRKANWVDSDKYFHAKANFQATHRGPGGEFFAIHFSNLRGIWDQRIKGDTREESLEDQKANIYGRRQAKTYEPLQYKEALELHRPNNLPFKY